MIEPKGRGADWTEERGSLRPSDEGSRRSEGGTGRWAGPRRREISTVPLPADAFDSHCHLDLIERPVPEVLADARAARITRVVTIGVDLPTSRWAADCADAYRDVYAAVAIHPNETARAAASAAARDAVLAEIAALARRPRVR